MGRVKQIDSVKTIFTVSVETTVTHHKETAIKLLHHEAERKYSFMGGGIHVNVKHVEGNVFTISTSGEVFRNAMKSRTYLSKHITRALGHIEDEKIYGRAYTRNKPVWYEYFIHGKEVLPTDTYANLECFKLDDMMFKHAPYQGTISSWLKEIYEIGDVD